MSKEHITNFNFAKNPEFINKKGRPRKLIGEVQKQLELIGIKPPTATEVKSLAMTFLNLTQKQIKTLLQDEEMPMYVRIVLKEMLKDKGFEIIEKLLDRGIGKPTNNIDLSSLNENINTEVKMNEKQFNELTNMIK